MITKSKAVELFGSVSNLARALGISSQAVSQWPQDRIPEKHFLRIKHELRPKAFRTVRKPASP